MSQDVTESHSFGEILAGLGGREGHPRRICRVEQMGLAGSDHPTIEETFVETGHRPRPNVGV
jgi:hypothetical protein